LRKKLDKPQEQINLENARDGEPEKRGCFSIRGFGIRPNRNRERKTYVSETPRMKKRKGIGRKVKAVFKALHEKPLKGVI
jgi:hypothetical protein